MNTVLTEPGHTVYEPCVVKATEGWCMLRTFPVFILWHAVGSHMAQRNDSIMQNHSVKKWGPYFYGKHQNIKYKTKQKSSITFF
jgi:hypothetical protein